MRETYQTIKSDALETYFEGCRDHAIIKGWSHENIIGYVDYQFEHSYNLPIEKLMWNVVLLVLTGGWHKEQEKGVRHWISDCLSQNKLELLLADVPKDEADEFMHDMKILQLV